MNGEFSSIDFSSIQLTGKELWFIFVTVRNGMRVRIVYALFHGKF